MPQPSTAHNMRALTIGTICGALGLLALAPPNNPPPIVQTDTGMVRGAAENGVRSFLGIPFAAPPVGPLRFRPPQPPAAWRGVRDALHAGPECPQAGSSTQDTTEDCLYLNVWTPAGATKRPVFVFIYGGGFTQGTGAAYDGSLLSATGNIIVVTMNYRNGIFGFLASAALNEGGTTTGNYGIEDQQATLRWVQRNIGNFGGDPRNVTLGGESAGAMSTCANLVAPGAGGTFVRAVVESGPCSNPMPALDATEIKHAPIVAQLGCTGSGAQLAACLRSPGLTVKAILAVQQTLPRGTFAPSVGGSDIPVQPRSYLGRVPLLLGGNNLEAGYTVLLAPPATAGAYQAALQRDYGAQAAAVAAQYPAANYLNPGIALATVETDSAPSPAISVCSDVSTWRVTRDAGSAPIYAYEFNDPNAYAFDGVPGPVHTSELPYLFPRWNNDATRAGKGLAPASQALSTTMLRYWTNFVTSGNPNGPGLPTWPAYSVITDVLQLTPSTIATGTDVSAEHKCPFWNSLNRSL
jgi:para-nitrobenzyl esterase